jgi:hypothetical protein
MTLHGDFDLTRLRSVNRRVNGSAELLRDDAQTAASDSDYASC